VGSTCTYDEEMTNFANWYAYYKTRNQMMKTAVGQAFQPLNSNYNVGIVSLSTAAAEVPDDAAARVFGYQPQQLVHRPVRDERQPVDPAAPGPECDRQDVREPGPYVAASGKEVVQYPCQQNFTFVTTDGYWNGGAARSP
jgi:type IV pilus assembly protein PilY1